MGNEESRIHKDISFLPALNDKSLLTNNDLERRSVEPILQCCHFYELRQH